MLLIGNVWILSTPYVLIESHKFVFWGNSFVMKLVSCKGIFWKQFSCCSNFEFAVTMLKYFWAIISKDVRNWRLKMPENNFNKVSTLWTCQTYMENMSTVLKPGEISFGVLFFRQILRQLRTFLKLLPFCIYIYIHICLNAQKLKVNGLDRMEIYQHRFAVVITQQFAMNLLQRISYKVLLLRHTVYCWIN